MKPMNSHEIDEQSGAFICLYSQSAVGKTVTTLKTAPKPIAYLTFEGRSIKRIKEAVGDWEGIDTFGYTNFLELMDFLINTHQTIFADGLSYLMMINLTSEVKHENIDKKKGKPTIFDITKVSQPDQGEVNQGVFRILNALSLLVHAGKTVIITCLESERKRYRVSEWAEVAGPELGGKQVPNNFPGFFDLIGRLTPHIHQPNIDGVIDCPYCKSPKIGKLYPPIVSFDDDGNFLAKFTGSGTKKTGPLNWEKILKKM
jgi:hypothetical protein